MRELFDLEVRYSFVYCLAPSARAPCMTDYGRLLIFEHTLAYLDRMYEVAFNGSKAAFYTYHDALRVFFMVNQFVAVLWDAEDLLLAGVSVAPPPTERGKPPPPPLPARSGGPAGDNLDRSLRCLERTIDLLGKFGEQWTNAASLKQSLELTTSDLMGRLRMRQQIRQRASPSQSVSPPMPREMRWVGVDVEAMMRGTSSGSRS